MIVKVQLPLNAKPEDPALIYNQARTMQATVPVTDALRGRFNGKHRLFFEATVDGDGNIELGEILKEQGW